MTQSIKQDEREERLQAIRDEADAMGTVHAAGIRAVASPMPVASPQAGYYGQPLLKEPQWTPLIPVYFFVGGAAGALGVIGSLADLLSGQKELARKARWLALAGSGLSSALLIADLGKPSRFFNMLRVLKPQSAMSVGSWVLSGFGASAAASSLADVLEAETSLTALASYLRAAGRTGCILFGMPFHNYTGVLIGASVIPAWNNRIRSLPREFGMSGLQSAVSILELCGEESHALNVLGLVSAGFESWEGIDLLRSKARELGVAKRGLSGFLVQLAGALSGPVPIAFRLASLFMKNSRTLRRWAALSGIAGSLLMRYGWVNAGAASSRDWKIPLNIDDDSDRLQDAKEHKLVAH